MKPKGLRILVIGAGVNGSVCAMALHKVGYNVTMLARGHRFEELRACGIEIEDPLKNTRSVTRVPVIDHLETEDSYDYILVAVRKNQVQEPLPVLAQNRSASVVFMVNTASGPEEWVQTLGASRVMLGFAFAGGRREGNLIRAIRGKMSSTPFGEVDGTVTDRLIKLVGILNRAGLHAKAIADMPDWLVTHAAMVAPLAMLILKHGCDTYSLARSKEDLTALVTAMRETRVVLRSAGRQIKPELVNIFMMLPLSLIARLFRVLLSSKYGEIGAGWHCSQAPDEMLELARELKVLAKRSDRPAPTLDRLLATV